MKYLVFGSEGQLGKEFLIHLNKKNIECYGYDINTLDISNEKSVAELIASLKPNIIINCAAYNQVDLAENNPTIADSVNCDSVAILAKLSTKYNYFLVHYGTDYIFDGYKRSGLYIETDNPNPLNNYGKSKLNGELQLKNYTDNYLLFRLSWVFGLGKQNFIYKLLEWCKTKELLNIVCDEISVPTYTKDVVEVTLKAINSELKGTYHLTNNGYVSRFDWAKFILQNINMKKILLPGSIHDFNLAAKRPFFSAMDNTKITKELILSLPTWEEATKEYLQRIL